LLTAKLFIMELRQLRYFIAVARTLSFTEAAKQLYITQGTLSQQLRQLEFELGSDLFVRNSRNVMLTEAGQTLLPLATRMIETSELCQSQMKDLRSGVRGELRIGVSNSMKRLVGNTAKEFLKRYPDVSLLIYCRGAMDLLRRLRANELDMIVSFRQWEPQPDLDTKILFSSRLSVIMSSDHYLAGRSSLRLDDLSRFGMILPGGGLQARRIFENFFSVNISTLGQHVVVNDVDIILDLIKGTDRVALLSSAEIIDRKGFVAVPLTVGNGELLECREMVCCAQRLVTSYTKRSTLAFAELLSEQAHLERICMELG